jgi:hypothetical protein
MVNGDGVHMRTHGVYVHAAPGKSLSGGWRLRARGGQVLAVA